MAHKVIALIPVKPLATAKGRLARTLPGAERQALTLLCLHRVLQALHEAELIAEVLVIGSDPPVHRLAEEMEAGWLPDPGWDLNESLREGFAYIFRQKADACLFLPADLPLVTAPEVDGVVAASQGLSRLVLAPTTREGGTNGILLPSPDRIGVPFQPHMGPGSLALHLEEARSTSVPVEEVHSPGLAFDVDTPQDLQRLRERLPTLDTELQEWVAFLEAPAQPVHLPAREAPSP